jgi:hypothetical protein
MNDNKKDYNSPLPTIRHLELLELAQSVIACTEKQLKERFPDAEHMVFMPRFYRLHFANATLTWIINAFSICDLSFIEFDTIADVAICRYICRTHYNQLKNDLWITDNLFIEYSTHITDNSFRFAWRHDEILCRFG